MENELNKNKKGIYLYAVIRCSEPVEFGNKGIGDDEDLVYGIHYKDICAIVSLTSYMRYEARRKYLMAHQMIQEEVMKKYPILPVSYSTISESTDENLIVEILKREYNKFSGMLASMEGKREFGLKAVAIEESIYNYILEKYTNIRELKEKVALLLPNQAHFSMMKVGELVENALKEEVSKFREIILNALTPLAEDVKTKDMYGERMITNTAFLVSAKNEAAFDHAIHALDKQYGNLISFIYVGPLPPYNFVNVVINTNHSINAY